MDTSTLRPNWQLRQAARGQLAGNWGKAILIGALYYVITMIANMIPWVGTIASILISGPLYFGLCTFFIKLMRNDAPSVVNLFDGFNQFWKTVGLWLMVTIFTLLWSLLLIIPGIIAAYRYSQAFFILNDHPDIGIMEAIERSKAMMVGHKWNLFMLGLSFIGWILLGVITFGIGMLWVFPYLYTAAANFYENLKHASIGSNVTGANFDSSETIQA